MATRLYFADTAPAVTPTPHTQWGVSAPFNYASLVASTTNTAYTEKSKGRGSGVVLQGPAIILVSAPLSIGTKFLTSQSFMAVARAREPTTNHDVSSCVSIRIVDGSGTQKAVLYTENIIGSGNVNEWSVSLRNQKFPRGAADSTGTALQANYTTVAGDRLEVSLGGRLGGDFGTAIVEVGDVTASSDLVHNNTGTTAGRGWVEFSHNFTFGHTGVKLKASGTFVQHPAKRKAGGTWQEYTPQHREAGNFS